ncbi:sigma-70 family RNA polymerase sigma factor [bacterium]|nr:sigma-70 family RNA polymerase sigma factor [bacterium]
MGDESAFDELFSRYRQRLFSFFYRIISERENSLDLVQETMLSAYKALDRWQPRAKFSTWLYTVAANKARTFLRATRRQIRERPLEVEHWQFGDTFGLQVTSKEMNPEQQYDAELIEDTFRLGISKLPDQQRKVFILRHQNSLKLKEIAEVLKLKEGSVKAHLFKAVANLMKHFAYAGVHIDARPIKGGADE